MLVELSRSAERWDSWASPAFPDAYMVVLEWSSHQKLREVRPGRPGRWSVRDGRGEAAQGGGRDRRLGGAHMRGHKKPA